MTPDELFCDLLERSNLTPDEWRELERLSRQLDARDRYLDAHIREGFRELERTGELRRLH